MMEPTARNKICPEIIRTKKLTEQNSTIFSMFLIERKIRQAFKLGIYRFATDCEKNHHSLATQCGEGWKSSL